MGLALEGDIGVLPPVNLLLYFGDCGDVDDEGDLLSISLAFTTTGLGESNVSLPSPVLLFKEASLLLADILVVSLTVMVGESIPSFTSTSAF